MLRPDGGVAQAESNFPCTQYSVGVFPTTYLARPPGQVPESPSLDSPGFHPVFSSLLSFPGYLSRNLFRLAAGRTRLEEVN